MSVEWLREQDLIYVQSASAKSMGRAGHVESPYAVRDVVGNATRFLSMSFQPLDPVMEGQSIVLS